MPTSPGEGERLGLTPGHVQADLEARLEATESELETQKHRATFFEDEARHQEANAGRLRSALTEALDAMDRIAMRTDDFIARGDLEDEAARIRSQIEGSNNG